MTKNHCAAILSAMALVGSLVVGIRRSSKAAENDDEPQAAVYLMMEAARAGNVTGYLDSFTSPAIEPLRQAVAEGGKSEFSQSLRETNAGVAGLVVSDPEFTGNVAKLRVEYIYQERNAIQDLYLEKVRGRWRILRAQSEELSKMPVPFGTVVK